MEEESGSCGSTPPAVVWLANVSCPISSGWKFTAELPALELALHSTGPRSCLLPVSEYVHLLCICALISTYKDTSPVGSRLTIVTPSYPVLSHCGSASSNNRFRSPLEQSLLVSFGDTVIQSHPLVSPLAIRAWQPAHVPS